MTDKRFKPAPFLQNRHLQTLFATFFRKEIKLDFEIEEFRLDDGDFVECYWHNRDKMDKGIVILFHGLEGSYRSPYIQGVMRSLAKSGFCSVVMHFRGCAQKENLLPRSYHSGDTKDARAYIKHLQKLYKDTPLFGVGYSLGANMLLKLLATYKNSSPLKAAVSVSAPMQLDICADQMDRGFSKIYQAHLMKHLNASLLKKYKRFPMKKYINLDEKQVLKLRTFWEFDNAYTAPIHGFKSAKDYYQRSSAKQFLKEIQTKTLIIHALDDPFMTPDILPKSDEISDFIEMELYPHGGHVGFISGTVLKPEYWLDKRISDYFSKI
jgi:predicted alpha/beta-fold hydrolase